MEKTICCLSKNHPRYKELKHKIEMIEVILDESL